MTYGAVQGRLREAMCELLAYRKVLAHLGGQSGRRPERTTSEERAGLSALVQRYRVPVVQWLDELADIAVADLVMPDGEVEASMRRMARMLARVRDHTEAPRPTLIELDTPQPLPLVEAWRHAALAATQGREREVEALRRRLSQSEALTVLSDVADVSRALAFLDERYRKLPGWRHLGDGVPADGDVQLFAAPVSLLRAAEGASMAIAALRQAAETSVDTLGYRRPVDVVDGPYGEGVSGALDALANSFRRLRSDFPSGRALRMLVRIHHDVSRHAARLARDDPTLEARFERRVRTYRRLLTAVRNVDGLLGAGMDAVADATSGLERLAAASQANERQRAALARGLAATDRRICDILRLGAGQRLYFVATGKHLEQVRHGVTARATTTFAPITEETHPTLLRVVHDLWPEPVPSGPVDDRSRLRGALSATTWKGRTSGASQDAPVTSDPSGSVTNLGL